MFESITRFLSRINFPTQKSLERKTESGITPANRSILVTAGGLTWAMEVA